LPSCQMLCSLRFYPQPYSYPTWSLSSKWCGHKWLSSSILPIKNSSKP
jgi:hypothetical protein